MTKRYTACIMYTCTICTITRLSSLAADMYNICKHMHCVVCQACACASVLISRSEHNERRFSFFYIILFIFPLQCVYDESHFFFYFFFYRWFFFSSIFYARGNEKMVSRHSLSMRRKYNICARAQCGVDHDDYDEGG
jgi:hypothetical protein